MNRDINSATEENLSARKKVRELRDNQQQEPGEEQTPSSVVEEKRRSEADEEERVKE